MNYYITVSRGSYRKSIVCKYNSDDNKFELYCFAKNCCGNSNVKYALNFLSKQYAEEFKSVINYTSFYGENPEIIFEIIEI